MKLMDHFEQLRRAAHERGMADYDRAVDAARHTGKPPLRKNPFGGNYATDEWSAWSEGWGNAEQLAQEDRHVEHVKAGYNVATLSGGTLCHLRKMGEDAICEAKPKFTTAMGRKRAGWNTFRTDGIYRATCWKCIDQFNNQPKGN